MLGALAQIGGAVAAWLPACFDADRAKSLAVERVDSRDEPETAAVLKGALKGLFGR